MAYNDSVIYDNLRRINELEAKVQKLERCYRNCMEKEKHDEFLIEKLKHEERT